MTKSELWQAIKQKDPKLEALLNEIKEKMGKPEAVINVRFNEETLNA